MNKKIIFYISMLLITIGSIFAIPENPKNFYGDVTVNGKEIGNATLNYYFGDEFGTKPVINSKYGQRFDKIIVSGENLQTITFELVANSCANSNQKINHSIDIEDIDKTIKLDLNFKGTNTCGDTPIEPEDNTDDDGGSSGGSSSGGSTKPKKEEPIQLNETEPESRKQILQTKDSSGKLPKLQKNESKQKNSNRNALYERDDGIKVESSKTPITNENKLGGNILKSTSNTIIGIIILVLILTIFIIWRENKKRKRKKSKK